MKHLFLLTFVALFAPFPIHAGDPSPVVHRIAVHFHLVSDMPMTMKGVTMTNWLAPEMIETTVMPEVNRIWSSAQIEWTLSGVSSATTQDARRAGVISTLLTAVRDSEGHGDPERIKQLQSILNLEREETRAVNIYVVPYLGGTSQGHALPGQKRVMVGQWTDKPSHGRHPPEKCLIVEKGEFQQGSFSRTVAHELGHIVGLQHPPKNTPPFHRLMGGSNPGNDLTDAEKTTSRQKASVLVSELKGR